jgi:hypothetical protein
MMFEVWIDDTGLNKIGGLHGEKTPDNELTIEEMKGEIEDALDNQWLEGFYSVEWKPPAE